MNTSDFLPFSQRDIADALGPMMLARAGIRPAADPVAAHLANEQTPLWQLARHYLAPHFPESALRAAYPSDLLSRALGVSDFGSDLARGFQAVASASFDEQIAGISRCWRQIVVKNFLPVSIPHLSVADLEAAPPEFDSWGTLSSTGLSATGILEHVSVTSYGLRLIISRQALVNDAVNEMAVLFAALGSAAAKNISARLAAVLEDSSALNDGTSFFHSSHANVLTGAAPSVTTLDAVSAALWRQPTPAGSIGGTAPRFVIVPAALAATTHSAITAIFGPGADRLGAVDAVICPHLSSATTWFACGSPISAPTLGLLTLGPSATVAVERLPLPPGRDGICMQVVNNFRIARLSRIGIVKVTT